MGPDLYATHQGVLAACAAASAGAILEIGAGWYSTPLLHGLCVASGRKLVTIESSQQWIWRWLKWDGPAHRIVHRPTLCAAPELGDQWGMVLVDCDPADARRDCLVRLARTGRSALVVVHDTQDDASGNMDSLNSWRHRWDSPVGFWSFQDNAPPRTSVVSDRLSLDWLDAMFPKDQK